MTKTYDIDIDADNPFYELSRVAAWWQLRPTDKGDGEGYTGMALHVKRYHGTVIDNTEFQGPLLPFLIRQAIEWASEFTKAAPQTSKTKRVIPRT
jgi:hypothetical protein